MIPSDERAIATPIAILMSFFCVSAVFPLSVIARAYWMAL